MRLKRSASNIQPHRSASAVSNNSDCDRPPQDGTPELRSRCTNLKVCRDRQIMPMLPSDSWPQHVPLFDPRTSIGSRTREHPTLCQSTIFSTRGWCYNHGIAEWTTPLAIRDSDGHKSHLSATFPVSQKSNDEEEGRLARGKIETVVWYHEVLIRACVAKTAPFR